MLAVPLLAAAATLVAACQPLPTPPPTATVRPSATATAILPTATATTQATATATATVTPDPTAVPTRLTRPTATPIVFGPEEDECWAACKTAMEDPPTVGPSTPQPASHGGRETCLVCHKDMAKPALPADHAGRMDPACALCHEPAASRPALTPTP